MVLDYDGRRIVGLVTKMMKSGAMEGLMLLLLPRSPFLVDML